MTGYTPFGELKIEPMFHQTDLKGVGMHSSPWHILETFTRETEGVASRVSFGPSGAIILTTIPGDPNSGAFYLWDRQSKQIFMLTFETQDTFNATWFDIVFTTYNLHELVDRKEKQMPVKKNARNARRAYIHRAPSKLQVVPNAIAA